MKPCVLCEIVAGRAPASIVDRDATCTAFLDIQPINPGHLLVVPLRASGLRCEGVDLFLADGAAAGQEVAELDAVAARIRPR